MVTAIEQLESRHKCLIYDGTPADQLPVIIPLLIEGLRTNWRCLYLGDPQTVRMVDGALRAKGIDVEREIGRSALVLSSDRSHLNGGFDPRSMVAMLRRLIDESVADGFVGLCATGDMMWELGNARNFDRVLEYEALLECVFHEKPLMGICQYHRSTVPARAVRDALLVHRSVYVGDVLNRDNLFYVPPELLLAEPDVRDRQGDWMCQQIIRVLKAEETRDRAFAALRESERQQRALAEDLARLNGELEQRVRERTADLETVNHELEAFSYSVSHDLRAPLRHIGGYSEILAEDFSDKLGSQGGRLIERIQAATMKMQNLIDAMLELSRVSKSSVRMTAVDLSAIAQAVISQLRAAEPTHEVAVTIDPGLAAMGDSALIAAVIDNLLGNAWKFTAKTASPTVRIGTTGAADGMAAFFVADNGAGFDMAYAERLFGAFQRLHSDAEFTGTGVGLATVQRIVHRHGGRVWATGQVGCGATFYFTLPAISNAPQVSAGQAC